MGYYLFEYFQNSTELVKRFFKKCEDIIIPCVFNFHLSTADNADTNTSKHHCPQTNYKMKIYAYMIVLLAFFIIDYNKIIVGS